MFEIDYETKFILTVIEFEYNSKDPKTKNVPGDIRRSFLGLKSPNIPSKVKVLCKYEDEIIYPIHFALIKKPVKIKIPGAKPRTTNTAVGAMILYEFLGIMEDYKDCCQKIEKFLTEKQDNGSGFFGAVSNIQLIIGSDLKDVAK